MELAAAGVHCEVSFSSSPVPSSTPSVSSLSDFATSPTLSLQDWILRSIGFYVAFLLSPAWCLLVLQVQRRTFRQQHDPRQHCFPSHLNSSRLVCFQTPPLPSPTRAGFVHHGAQHRGTRRDCAHLFRRSWRTGLLTPPTYRKSRADDRVSSKKQPRMLSTKWVICHPPRPNDD